MSGGVDSSVAASILKREGFLVEGVFFRFFKNKKAEESVKEVAKNLKVDLFIVDAEKDFQKDVVYPFLKILRKGKTPNPCVLCNREVKFSKLFLRMQKRKADYISTGHYVRILRGKENEIKILRGKDRKKDQSYFLWNIKKSFLPKIIFPLGELKKENVKKEAKKLGIYVPKKESQEICFAKEGLSKFLEKNNFFSPGDVLCYETGEVLGRHKGLFYYTTGQRKGISLPGGPYYVLKKDIKRNVLVVTKNEKNLFAKELFYEKANFFSDVSFPFQAEVKIRYASKLARATVEEKKVVFASLEKAITSGQSVVFYKNDELLGGGVIK